MKKNSQDNTTDAPETSDDKIRPWTEGEIVESLREGYSDAGLPMIEFIGCGLSEELVERVICRLNELQSAEEFNNLGVLHELGGEGITRDPERAVEFYVRASNLGSYIACENLGFLYQERSDEKEALEWFRKGSELRIEQSRGEQSKDYEISIFGGRCDHRVTSRREAFLNIVGQS